jgi:hypothetical protein
MEVPPVEPNFEDDSGHRSVSSDEDEEAPDVEELLWLAQVCEKEKQRERKRERALNEAYEEKDRPFTHHSISFESYVVFVGGNKFRWILSVIEEIKLLLASVAPLHFRPQLPA